VLQTCQGFSQKVCKLILCRHKTELNETFHEFMPDEVAVYLNVLCPLMEHRIFGNIHSSHAVTFDRNRCDVGEAKLMQQPAQPGKLSNQSS